MDKALSLISGGIDSPVATITMARQGLHTDCIHFSSSESQANVVLSLRNRIEEITGRKIKLYTIKHMQALEEISRHCNRRYMCLYCKRMMYRISEQVAHSFGYKYLITGENLGQVASQTLQNLCILSNAVKIPVLRPLLCYDKNEIIKKAEEFGTYNISITNKEECSMLPRSPATRARLDEVISEEGKADIPRLVKMAALSLRDE